MELKFYSEERMNENVVLCSCFVDGVYREYKKYSPIEKGPNNGFIMVKDGSEKTSTSGVSDAANPIIRDREKVVYETDLDDDLDR